MSKGNIESMKIGAAYVGVIVGAGFSTGQEVLKFFTNYGIYSYCAILISGIMLTFFGRQISKVGYGLDVDSHEPTITYLFGEKFGKIIDYILVFFLYAISVIMVAGSGSAFHESFGIPIWLGSLIMICAVVGTLLMDFNKIVRALGVVTPFLIIVVTIIAVYFFFKGHVSLSEVDKYIDPSKQPFKSKFLPEGSLWWFSGLNYGGLAFATGYSMLAAIGSDASKKHIAGRGAFIGGITLLVLLLMVNSGLLSELELVQDSAIPTLVLGRMIHPVLGIALSIIMLMVMYNTIVGLMYSFTARLTTPYSKQYIILLIVSMVIGYALSFVGFVELVGTVYPIMGYVGLLLCLGLLLKYIKRKKAGKNHIA